MEFKICANCGSFHLDDGKRLITEDGKAQPLKCSCINPRIMTVREWLNDIWYGTPYLKVITDLIKKYNLYEFAFKCIGEPYCEQYSNRIKNAIVDQCFCANTDEVAKLLENNKALLKEFYSAFSVARSKERFKEMRE